MTARIAPVDTDGATWSHRDQRRVLSRDGGALRLPPSAWRVPDPHADRVPMSGYGAAAAGPQYRRREMWRRRKWGAWPFPVPAIGAAGESVGRRHARSVWERALLQGRAARENPRTRAVADIVLLAAVARHVATCPVCARVPERGYSAQRWLTEAALRTPSAARVFRVLEAEGERAER